MMVAGFGCRAGVSVEAVDAALALALRECRASRAQLAAIATAPTKANEVGIRGLAQALGLPLVVTTLKEMQVAADRSRTHSPRVMAITGLPSVAETAALAAVGGSGRLMGPRVAVDGVTCALAVGAPEPAPHVCSKREDRR